MKTTLSLLIFAVLIYGLINPPETQAQKCRDKAALLSINSSPFVVTACTKGDAEVTLFNEIRAACASALERTPLRNCDPENTCPVQGFTCTQIVDPDSFVIKCTPALSAINCTGVAGASPTTCMLQPKGGKLACGCICTQIIQPTPAPTPGP